MNLIYCTFDILDGLVKVIDKAAYVFYCAALGCALASSFSCGSRGSERLGRDCCCLNCDLAEGTKHSAASWQTADGHADRVMTSLISSVLARINGKGDDESVGLAFAAGETGFGVGSAPQLDSSEGTTSLPNTTLSGHKGKGRHLEQCQYQSQQVQQARISVVVFYIRLVTVHRQVTARFFPACWAAASR